MGYWPTREKLHDWQPIFDEVLAAWRRGATYTLHLDHAADFGKIQHEIRTALYATELFPDEFEGRFVGLKQATRLKSNPTLQTITFTMKSVRPSVITKTLASDETTTQQLAERIVSSESTIKATVRLEKDQTPESIRAMLAEFNYDIKEFDELSSNLVRVSAALPPSARPKRASPAALFKPYTPVTRSARGESGNDQSER